MKENMNSEILAAINKLLRTGQVKSALDLMRTWLTTAAPGEPEALLAECDEGLKPKIALLMRDLLSRYPYTLVGAPVLLYYNPGPTMADTPNIRVPLPHPTISQASPCSDLHFLGWLNPTAMLPLAMPFRPERHGLHAPSKTIYAAVALFKSHPNVFDMDELILPNTWWAELFREVPGNVHMSARLILPYPDALETARELLRAATGSSGNPYHFISETAVDWAKNAGELFKETCRHQYPDRAF